MLPNRMLGKDELIEQRQEVNQEQLLKHGIQRVFARDKIDSSLQTESTLEIVWTWIIEE